MISRLSYRQGFLVITVPKITRAGLPQCGGKDPMKEDPIDTILGSLSAQEVTEKAEEAKGMETPEELPILPIR